MVIGRQQSELPPGAAPFPQRQRRLTWVGQPVLVARNVLVQGQEQDPEGQREHARQEGVEDEVEEQDEPCSSRNIRVSVPKPRPLGPALGSSPVRQVSAESAEPGWL